MRDPSVYKPTVKLDDILEDAEFAFWAEVVKHLPLAESGDFPPEESLVWDEAMERAVTGWWSWNASMHYDLQLPDGEIISEVTMGR